jgi:hypothetical protein
MALWDARKQGIETSDSAPGLLERLRSADRINPVGHERCGWRVTWLAAGLGGLDDEHAAATAGARVRERLCLIANACFHTPKARRGHGVGRICRLDLLEYSSPRRVPTRYASERSAVAINRSSPIAAWSCRVRAMVVCFPTGSPAVRMGVPNVTRTRGRCTKCAIRTSLGP